MSDFTITGRERTVLFAFMAVGLVCLIASYLWGDPSEIAGHHTRFWANFLHNSMFFTGISFTALFVICAFTTAYAGWFTLMKRVWEAFSLFLGVGLILMTIFAIATWLGLHDLYHWNVEGVVDPSSPAYDKLLDGKKGFLNRNIFIGFTVVILAAWYFFATRIRAVSLAEDEQGGKNNFEFQYTIRKWAAAFLPIGAFTSAALIWQWVMSVDSHWYSTMFAWYATASWFVSMLCITILMLIYFKSRGFLKGITSEHLHDLGKYLFAFSIFWTYLWFSQYMLIWYANVGEETIYFRTRVDQYPVLFYGNIVMNFLVPFFVLMRNSTKRKYGTLVFVCVIVLFGHWWDFFQMIRPGVLHTAHEVHELRSGNHSDHETYDAHLHGISDHDDHGSHAGHGDHDNAHGDHAHASHDEHGAHGEHGGDAHGGHGHAHFTPGFTLPGFLDIGTWLGFLAFFVWFVFGRIASARLEPINDPFLEESLNHHT